MIYGVATLAACMFCGSLIGNILGLITGTGSDIGGVGFAILLLILISNSEKCKFAKKEPFAKGISFWKAMYIPVVVAMAASQNVYQAVSGGALAITAGIGAVLASSAILPLFNKLAKKMEQKEDQDE